MAGFDAATAVEPMDYDFTKYKAGKGTVPEPSNDDMKSFQQEFATIMRRGQQLNVSEDEALKMSEEDFTAFQKQADEVGEELDAALAKLCQGQPSLDQLKKLPFRVKTAFSRWLMDQMSPEGGAAGTK